MDDKLFYRNFEFDKTKLDKENRSIELSLSSNNPVTHYYETIVLLHGKANVDLSQLNSALLSHDASKIIGRYENKHLEKGKQLRATLIFDDDDLGNFAMNKVDSGSLKGASIAFTVQKFKRLEEGEESDGYKGPVYIAMKWAPYEASLTPIPADSSVGIGRDLSQSLNGIEIEKLNLKEEKQMDEKEVQTMIDLAFEKMLETMKGIVPEIVSQVREALVDDAKPKMKIENDIFQDLLGRAGAVSLELKAKVADMAVEGKTEQEITRAILDRAIIDPDATDKGDLKDGTGLKNKDGDNRPEIITSFEKVEDDDFFRGLSEPIDMPLQ